ncbi:acyl-CoA dehydrogenase family protein [Sporichthya polymorpha]|uniref:acyl-CoA dehydrogenase family protein n=1 Tax=Sporichthya polymorpha TaxID=35751 RepID=UPI00036E0A15|nr:acyl-CoA dehydrogenase family protein [Sporichthya polymorpha]
MTIPGETAEDREYRRALRAWIRDNKAHAAFPRDPHKAVSAARDWQRRTYEAGYVGLAFPKRYGGVEATVMQQAICAEEFASHRLPPFINFVGLNIVGPTLVLHASEEQKERFVPRILTAEELWCQGYSEPGAGSDLASLRTRADIDGDEFVVTGQKVWTSLGTIADWCLLLVRSAPGSTGPAGISLLMLDMKSPGVTVRPLRNAAGGIHFSEIFLDEVRVPSSLLVGTVHEGWGIVRSSLDSERSGLSGTIGIEQTLVELVELRAKNARSGTDAALIDDDLARAWCAVQGLRRLGYRSLGRQLAGHPTGPESAIGKLFTSELRKDLFRVAQDILGPDAQLARRSPEAVDGGRWASLYLDSLAHTIGGGTSEVMRNVIAERVLELPRPTGRG